MHSLVRLQSVLIAYPHANAKQLESEHTPTTALNAPSADHIHCMMLADISNHQHQQDCCALLRQRMNKTVPMADRLHHVANGHAV